MGNYGCTSLRAAKIQLFLILSEKMLKNFKISCILMKTMLKKC